jgi:four helix bundle protein
MAQERYDLEARLRDYSVRVIRVVQALPKTRVGNHIGDHLLRSGTSPYFHHAEAQAAESAKDFVHKMRVCLKELRESHRCLLLIQHVPLIKPPSKLDPLVAESVELIKIFVSSIRTAQRSSRADRS